MYTAIQQSRCLLFVYLSVLTSVYRHKRGSDCSRGRRTILDTHTGGSNRVEGVMTSLPRPSAPTLAYLSAPGSISLPPPLIAGAETKSTDRIRTTSVPARPTGRSDKIRAASTARVLVGAAAVTAAKTFVLDVKHSHWHDASNGLGGWTDEGDNGGVALLVISLCLGRAVLEVRRVLRDRRSKAQSRALGSVARASRVCCSSSGRSTPELRSRWWADDHQSRLLWSVSAAAQVMAYFLAVKAIGPVRLVVRTSWLTDGITHITLTPRASILAAMATVFGPLFLAHPGQPKVCRWPILFASQCRQ